MAFKPGQSGNPGGRKKSLGLSRALRKSCGAEAWAMAMKILRGEVLEPYFDQETERTIYLAPGAKTRLEASKVILGYAWGPPQLRLDLREDLPFESGDTRSVMTLALNALLRGELSASQASGVAALVSASFKADELAEFAKRLEAIEERLKDLATYRGGMNGAART